MEGRYWYYTGSMFTASGVYLSQRHFCDGTDRRDNIVFSPGATYLALDKDIIYEKYCDGTEKLVYSHDWGFGLNPLMLTASHCLWRVEKNITDCRILDTLLAEFIIPKCTPSAEICDGKDNNCNGDIDEGGCDKTVDICLNSSANAANGNLSHNQELFTSRGTGLSISMTLYYNSIYSGSGHLGTGWSHSYDITLKEFPDGSILFREGNDRKLYVFSNGSYVNQAGDYSTLVKNPDGTYMLTKKDGTKYTFDTSGKLTKIEDRLGQTMTFIYSGDNLTEITDSVGKKTTLSYDSNNRIVGIVNHISASTLTYNLSGYLTAVTDSAGYSWTYTYDANGRMLTKSDTEGNVITYTYDSSGRILSSTDSAGQTKIISYSSPLAGEGGVRGQTTVTEIDGGIWSYTYDASNGTLTQKTDPQGNTTAYQYDSNRNLINETTSDGSITSYTYDAQGNMTSTTDSLGQTTTYTYNDYGQTASIKDPQSNVTHYSYDVYGNLTSVTDLSGGITHFNYDAKGNITRITSPNGGVTVYEYDQYNNITKITDPSGNTTSFTYDSSGNITSMTDSSGNTTRFEYNTLNQLIRITDPNGNITEYSYDSKGNKTSQTDANGNATFYEYNHKGQLIKVTDALGNVTTYTYGGTGGCPSCGTSGGNNLTSIADAKGQVTTYEYDTLGRLTKETDPLGNFASYSYDSKGNLISKTDANGNTITYTYDALGRLTKKTYPDSTTESFTYDSKGNIITASNQHISDTFTYDAAGKVTNVTDSYGRVIKYQYEVSGNKTQMTTPENKVITCSYDSGNRLTNLNTTLAGVAAGFSLRYDSAGRRTSLTYPNGATANYSYDALGRLTSLIHLTSKGSAIDSFSYEHDKVGNRLSKTEIEKKYSYSYDTIYRLLQSMPAKIRHNGEEREFEHKTELFTYDPAGNRLTGPKDKLNYTYNQGNQLTELTKQPSPPLEGGDKGVVEKKTDYSYDNNGNLIKKIELDDDSNVKKTTLYTYDYENRLIKVEIQKDNKAKVVSFTYDPFGRRLSKAVHREEIDDDNDSDKDDDDKVIPRATYYVYDNEDIIMQYNHRGKVTARYVHGQGIDEPLAIEQKGKVYYYHADGLGSITALTDGKGKVVQRYDYDSFGNMKHHGNKIKQSYTYTSREWDKETGLYYYRARYYDTKTGRFISKDPVGLRGGINRYAYVMNNPINKIDPLGLWTYATEYGTTGAGLIGNITGIENTIDSIFNSIANRDAVVTYAINGTHGANSLHYSGNAIDLRTRDLSPFQIQQIIETLRNTLGSDYDVINEGNHIHIEYDPLCR